MYTQSALRRRLVSGGASRDVELPAGFVGWLPAQSHHGESIGDTETRVVVVELKDGPVGRPSDTGSGISPQVS